MIKKMENARTQMRKRKYILGCGVVVVVLVRWLSDALRSHPAHAMLVALPGAAIFGFYAAAAANFIAMVIWHARIHRSWASLLTRHSLLFLVVAGFCMDYVLNNYAEISSPKDGSYGLVVLIDFLTWGVLWFISSLYFPKGGSDYVESSVAIFLPALSILRQMANAKHPIHIGAATVDLLVGALFAVAWILLPDFDERQSYPRQTRITQFFLLIGCLYSVLLLLENVLSHFFGLETKLFRDSRMFNFWFNVAMVFLATAFSVYLVRRPRFDTLFAGPCS